MLHGWKLQNINLEVLKASHLLIHIFRAGSRLLNNYRTQLNAALATTVGIGAKRRRRTSNGSDKFYGLCLLKIHLIITHF